MSERVSQVIVLCEDDPQERLVRSYLRMRGVSTRELRPVNASREAQGGGVKWVIERFPVELEACRRRHAVRAKTMLIAVVDADKFAVQERRDEFERRLPFQDSDPLVIFVPRRTVETWIRCGLGESVNEDDNYKKRDEPDKEDINKAARQIHDWARNSPRPPPECVPSLVRALPDWRRLG